MLVGFPDRLLNEVKKLSVKDTKIKIYAPPERKYSTWIGGSILAGLNTFKKVRTGRLFVVSFPVETFRLTLLLRGLVVADVGVRGRIPGRSRNHSQEISVLMSPDFFPTSFDHLAYFRICCLFALHSFHFMDLHVHIPHRKYPICDVFFSELIPGLWLCLVIELQERMKAYA